MKIIIDYPTFPAPVCHQAQQTLISIEESTSPIKQTFLLSPSPPSTTFRADSPILRSSLDTPTIYACSSSSSVPASIAGAYPTPRFYSPSIAQQSYRSSNYSNWSTDPTVVEGMLTPQLAATSMNDILPDDMDLYIDERPQTVRWSIVVSEGQREIAGEEEVDLGPEVRRQLPVIREGDFAYYPLPVYLSPARRMYGADMEKEKDLKKRTVMISRVRGFLKKAFGKKER